MPFWDAHVFYKFADDNFITDCESLYIIKAELDSLRALHDESHIPGHPKVRLYPGKSICKSETPNYCQFMLINFVNYVNELLKT